MTPYDLKVIIGSHDTCKPDITSTILSVTAVRVHPDYTERTRQNDIALLRLSVALKFSPYVAPICLPKFSIGQDSRNTNNDYDDDNHHHIGTVASWLKSTLAPNLTISDASCLPRQVGLPILDVSACSEAAPRTQGCLGIIGAPSLLCRGDAGAGVMVRRRATAAKRRRRHHRAVYVLIGVLSDQQYCMKRSGGGGGGGGKDAVVTWEQLQSFHGLTLPMYTRVAAHLRWIVRNTRDACFCGR